MSRKEVVVSLQELRKFTAVSKYAKWNEKLLRRETWPETVERNKQMMLSRFPALADRIDWAYAGVERMDILGSQRALQFGGEAALRHNARVYNCCSSYCNRLRFFAEAFYLLLCGCGTGFSVQDRHICRLPSFSAKRLSGAILPYKTYVVPDSIEGWADAMSVLLSSFHSEAVAGFEEYQDCNVVFDLSKIRKKGSSLSFGIGKAPGPAPLAEALSCNQKLLLSAVEKGLTKLDSIHAYDFLMHESDAVMAGGVRRSSAICLFDAWDQKMLTAKTGDWMSTNPQRARSNNSAVLPRDLTTFETFESFFRFIKEFGEPGFYWTSHPDALTNPCVEIGLYAFFHALRNSQLAKDILRNYSGPLIYNNEDEVLFSGWQFCNLSTINGSTVRDQADLNERCRMASTIGTLQASFTSFPYLGLVSELITKKEALIGVSLSGVMHYPELLLNPEVQQNAAEIVMETNREVASLIGINPAARTTCVKPDGNSSTLMGSFSGHHAGKFRRGFRIVQVDKVEAPYQFFRETNSIACEPSRWSKNKTSDAIRFCVEYKGILEEHLSAIDMLSAVKGTYENWVKPGKNTDLSVRPWLNHNVSNTVRVRDNEWEQVAQFIFDNRHLFTGISLIGWDGDRKYPQAPFTSVFTVDEQKEMYGVSAIVQANYLAESWRPHFSDLWDACAVATDRGLAESDGQALWLDECVGMAEEHFGGDILKATYCIKDAYNLKLWDILRASYSDVDYSQMIEVENGTNMQQELSCAGGACLT